MKLDAPVDDAGAGSAFSLSRDTATLLLLAIRAGWVHATADAGFSRSAHEPEMTQRLRTGMRLVADRPGSPLPMRVLPGTEVHTTANAPRPAGLTGISIIFDLFRGHDPHIVIECKRVTGNDANLCRLYVTEGIDRFKSGEKYGVNHDAGVMVGYVIREAVSDAVAGINGYLERRGRQDDHLTPSDLVRDTWAWQSIHARRDREPVELHHAFLMVPRTSEEAGES